MYIDICQMYVYNKNQKRKTQIFILFAVLLYPVFFYM